MTACLKSECQGLGYSYTIPNSPESLSQANHGISNVKKEYIIIIIIIALLQIKKAIIFPTETEKMKKKKINKKNK